MAISARQRQCLSALVDSKPHTALEIARRMDSNIGVAHHTLDALFRKSYVSITERGSFVITDRGLKRLNGRS